MAGPEIREQRGDSKSIKHLLTRVRAIINNRTGNVGHRGDKPGQARAESHQGYSSTCYEANGRSLLLATSKRELYFRLIFYW